MIDMSINNAILNCVYELILTLILSFKYAEDFANLND